MALSKKGKPFMHCSALEADATSAKITHAWPRSLFVLTAWTSAIWPNCVKRQ
jgi:hypothetical protein